MKKLFTILILFLTVAVRITSQDIGVIPSQDTLLVQDTIPDRLIIENEGRRIVEVKDSIQYLYENVRAKQDSTYFFSDSAILARNYFIAMSNVVILQTDTIRMFADSLYYNRDSSLAEMYNEVVLENGRQSLSGNAIFYQIDDQVAYYVDTAVMNMEDGSQLQSIEGKYFLDEKVTYFEKDVILKSDEFLLRTASMIYYNEEAKAVFTAPTRIKTKDAEIYCEDGFYNTKLKEGVFKKNAQYKGKDKEVVGEEIYYNDSLQQVKVIGQAVFNSEDGRGVAEEMEYNENNKDVILMGNATFEDDRNKVKGERIVFNDDSGDLYVAGNGFLSQEETIVEAYNIEYNENTGLGEAEGNVVYTDTSTHSKLFADLVKFNKIENGIKAYNYDTKPYMEIHMADDTMFLSSDTIVSYEIVDTLGIKHQYLIGDHHTKIYRTDFQAVCDSFVYNMADSMITLVTDPVMWTDTTQFSADTIQLFLKNDKLHKMKMIQNAIVLNSPDSIFFNQVKGKLITAYFVEDDVDRFVVEGNAQSVYYVLDDDKAYIGVNTTECSLLKFSFDNNEISGIRGYTDVKQKMIPIGVANHESLKLEGVKWRSKGRPTSIKDIIITNLQ